MRLNPQTYALTVVTFQRHRIFQRTANAELLIATLARHREQKRYLLHGFVVMPDHIHVLLTPTESIEKAAQLIKGGYSFAIRKHYPGEIWQEKYHAHRVLDGEDFHSQLHYIANNPTRKNLDAYPHVHTQAAVHLDSQPAQLL